MSDILDPTALSPLHSADPNAISALFASDPTTLTDTQFNQLILEMRRRRSAFASEEAAKAAKGKKERAPRAAAPTPAELAVTTKPVAELTADDLFGPAG